MSRKFTRILTVLLAVLTMLPVAGAAVAAPAPQVAMPALDMVPLRAVAEAVGATVSWNQATWEATVVRGDVTLVTKIGQGSATVNGVALPVGAPVTLENGRTMLPLPFLKAALGVEVAWDGSKAVVDKVATRAMDFVREMAKGTFDVDAATPAFKTIRPAPMVAAIANQLKQMGAVGQMGVVSHTRNAVHESVQLMAVIGMTPWEITVRFTPDGKLIDDYYMNYFSVSNPAGPAAYVLPDSFTEKEIVIGEGTAFPLPGTLTMPKGEGPFPLVVLVHGSGPNDRDESVGGVKMFRDIAQGLGSKGIAVLRYEKRTREHSQKTALIPNFGLKAETVDDALLAVKYAAGLDGVDPHRIYVLGHSQGGYAIPRIIDQDTEKLIAGALIAAGPSDFMQAVLDQNKLMVDAKLVTEAQWPFIQQQVAMLRDPSFD
ncbi:MAG TPA: alpha/beta fold hydrolase, partial [Symbiobacteriaceae bacterium]|nr:alpha/beta fold hydrolase [Symbiobacteriaceae bacterium]